MAKQSRITHTERLVIRLTKDQMDEIRKKAKEHELSVSAYVRMVLKRHGKGEV